MDRKQYMKTVYPKYWMTARDYIYGFSDYDRNLCNYIRNCVPSEETLLEVAIGNGYPVADFLQKTGYPVYGVDISSELIKQCQTVNGIITCLIGDAENLPYADNSFGCTYCFHSTWYFPDLNRVIDEMLRVTRPGGVVVFDIQNANCEKVARAYRKRLSRAAMTGQIFRYVKNVAKVLLRRGTPQWHSVVYEVPTRPESLYEHFKSIRLSAFRVMVRRLDGTLELRDGNGSFGEWDRLLFVVEK
jgi:ubiquinone/menaquinone biosynthesis C-methylase UbiE